MQRSTSLIVITAVLLQGSAMSVYAQAPEVSSSNTSCRISLPYKPELLHDCSAKLAAAYDFAFCGVFYIMAAESVPQAEAALGEKGRAAIYRRNGSAYLRFSELLSSSEVLKTNLDLSKQFFEGIGKDGVSLRAAKIDHVRNSCSAIENWHSEILPDLLSKVARMQRSGIR